MRRKHKVEKSKILGHLSQSTVASEVSSPVPLWRSWPARLWSLFLLSSSSVVAASQQLRVEVTPVYHASTQAAFTDSHHVGVPPLDADHLSQAAAHQYLFLLSQKWESLIYTYCGVHNENCIISVARSTVWARNKRLHWNTKQNTQPTVFVTYTLCGFAWQINYHACFMLMHT